MLLGKTLFKHRPVALFVLIGGIAAAPLSSRCPRRFAARRRAPGGAAALAAARQPLGREYAAAAGARLLRPGSG
jgi:hypothetical protein